MISTMKHTTWPNQIFEEDSQVPLFSDLSSPLSHNLHLHEYINPSNNKIRYSAPETAIKSILESRRAFLASITSTESNTTGNAKQLTQVEVENVVQTPGEIGINSIKKRKISFKVKSTYNHNNRRPNNINIPTTLSANKVAQLTQKFNQLIHEEPKIARAVRRANSIKPRDTITSNSCSVSNPTSSIIIDGNLKKPSLKPKPIRLEEKKKPSVKRRTSSKKIKHEVVSNYKNKSIINHESDTIDGVTADEIKLQPIKDPPRKTPDYAHVGSVRATIEKFERRTSESSPDIPLTQPRKHSTISEKSSSVNVVNDANKKPVVPKPKVPEKTITAKTKNLVIKDGVRKMRIVKTENTNIKKSILKNISSKCNSEESVLEKKELLLTEIAKQKTDAEIRPNHKDVQNITPSELSKPESIKTVENEEIILETKQLPSQNYYSKTKSLYYERLKIAKTTISSQVLKMAISEDVKPNNSFLWRSRSSKDSTFNTYASIDYEEPEETSEILDTGQKPVEDENVENIYDTVDPPKEEIQNEEDEQKYQKILEKTDEILKVYKSNKILEYFPLKSDETEVPNMQENAYESFYSSNTNYEEPPLYEYPKLGTNISPSEDIYETVSIKELPEQVDGKIFTKPLPKLPYSSLSSYSSGITERNNNLDKQQKKLLNIDDASSEEEIYSVVKESNCYETIYPSKSSPSQHNLHPPRYNSSHTHRYESYESIFYPSFNKTDNISSSGSNRGSIISCDQQSNSLYGKFDWNCEGGTPGSEISSSDRSDDWVDLSDPEFDDLQEPGLVIFREKQKSKKNPDWSHKVRDQFSKFPQEVVVHENDALSDSNHYYESLHSDEDFDSFDSDSDDDDFTKINPNDSGVDMGNCQLPDPPGGSSTNSQIYGLTRLAATAGKHMKRLRRNWSLTKNDITKSLSRMTKKKSSLELTTKSPTILSEKERSPPPLPSSPQPDTISAPQLPPKLKPTRPPPPLPKTPVPAPSNLSNNQQSNAVYQVPTSNQAVIHNNIILETEKIGQRVNLMNSMGKKKNWLKFRRTISVGETSDEIITAQNLTKSTFYLSNESTDVDIVPPVNGTRHMSLTQEQMQPVIPVRRRPQNVALRPQMPPPPAPIPTEARKSLPVKKEVSKEIKDTTTTKECKEKLRSTSWYAECGLFKATNPTDSTSPPSKTPRSPKSTPVIVTPSVIPPQAPTPPNRSPSTCWYAEVGLYQQSGSTPSTSSAENSGSSPGNIIGYGEKLENINEAKELKKSKKDYQLLRENKLQNNQEEYYNMRNSKEYRREGSEEKGDKKENENGCYYNEEFCDTEKLKKQQSGDMQLLLKDEPLYQFYDAALADSDCHETSSDSDYDGYEEIGTHRKETTNEGESPTSQLNNQPLPLPSRPSAMQLVSSPVRSRLSGAGGGLLGRTLWCEIPEVVQSDILCTLTASQKKLQEAKFEILTSEASYLNSLTVLEDHFILNLDKDIILDPEERKILFGNVKPVLKCSERMLSDLESCWQSSILLPNICNVILNHCINNFSVYINYCANQVRSDATLRRCRGDVPTASSNISSPGKVKVKFVEALKKLEASHICQALSFHSFLMLPMQRVTRLPLLVDAVLKRLTAEDDEYEDCQKALRALNEIVARCNEAAREAERLAEVQRIAQQLEYPPHIPPIDLTQNSPPINTEDDTPSGVKRWLVRSGDLTQLVARGGKSSADDGSIPVPKLTFGKRFTKLSITLFLFEDVLVVSRKKNDDQYVVLHHCPRSFVEVSTSTLDPNASSTINSSDPNSLLLFLTLLENHDGRTVELMLSCSTETDRQRWLEALRPPIAEDPGESVYESWDCPQVKAMHPYQAGQPDELALSRGDVVNVDRKMADGWYHGTRLRDGVVGWFPGNYSIEIANPHVRARNLRQRYRLLAFTDTYLNSNK